MQFGDFLLQILHTRGRWLGFEPIEQGLRLLRVHHEERVQSGTDWGRQSDDYPIIDILKEAPECCLDNPGEFVHCRDLNAQIP